MVVTEVPPTVIFKTKALINEKALFNKVDKRIGIANNKITFQGLPSVKSIGLKILLINFIINN